MEYHESARPCAILREFFQREERPSFLFCVVLRASLRDAKLSHHIPSFCCASASASVNVNGVSLFLYIKRDMSQLSN